MCTDKDTGIVGDNKDIFRRQEIFGRNKIYLPQVSKFSELLASQFEDDSVVFLIMTATIFLFLSVFTQENSDIGRMEALTIYVGVTFAALISAFSDYVKES